MSSTCDRKQHDERRVSVRPAVPLQGRFLEVRERQGQTMERASRGGPAASAGEGHCPQDFPREGPHGWAMSLGEGGWRGTRRAGSSWAEPSRPQLVTVLPPGSGLSTPQRQWSLGGTTRGFLSWPGQAAPSDQCGPQTHPRAPRAAGVWVPGTHRPMSQKKAHSGSRDACRLVLLLGSGLASRLQEAGGAQRPARGTCVQARPSGWLWSGCVGARGFSTACRPASPACHTRVL